MNNPLFQFEVEYAGAVDIGRARSTNQDEIILVPQFGFYGVSDGMGGLEGGADASAYVKEAMEVMIEPCSNDVREYFLDDENNIAGELKAVVRLISDQLFYQGNEPGRYTFGATLAGAWLVNSSAFIVWIGDSRCYLLPHDDTNLLQVTLDMNVAGELVRQKKLTPEEALNHPGASQLTAFIGMDPKATPRVSAVTLEPGDQLLLCSDGLYSMISQEAITGVLSSDLDANAKAHCLIDMANEAGGDDNISVVVIKIGQQTAGQD